jgi:hypothetical protein
MFVGLQASEHPYNLFASCNIKARQISQVNQVGQNVACWRANS